jgi:hypothetical protein
VAYGSSGAVKRRDETVKALLDQLKRLIKIPDDYKIIIENKRCKLPTASVYPKSKIIKITANKPSLIRYALAELILHEIAEDEFYMIDPDCEDSHVHPDFRFLEMAWRNKIEEAIANEHD